MTCPYTRGVIAKVMMDCLSQYCLENKIFVIVVDNATTNDAMMKILMDKFEKRSLMLEGDLSHLRCSAHILNLIVQDRLGVISSAIEKVRDCVSFWMSTPKRIENFEEACHFLDLANIKRHSLDCKTRWNLTYLMLKTVLPFKDVFSRLKRLNKKMNFVIPSDKDWALAELVCDKLEIFYSTTNVFFGRKFITINLFRRVCEIKLAMGRLLQSDVEIIRLMIENMLEIFDKYWDHMCELLAIATILDPSNKMDSRVRRCLDNLVVEYQRKSNIVKNVNDVGQSRKQHAPSSIDGAQDEFAQSKRTKVRKVNRCELDFYLEEEPLSDDEDLDVLY
ncbi:zinc finger BED domain-containing protein RICESLEEPER 2-like [Amaranthus tricolor]|uniref:zinc finger BED domain-containing protein RICESLEEPER 2-like n=1 Tax=Amaranthus tricolor TaxID=29722 RepID=UPI00258461AB|nr:zinc finger BED domain-containing protein RICESLEEPER 2-like [Amaranthus tricolor]